jgi:competence protein ComEA
MAARDQLLFGAAGAALIAVALSLWLLIAPAPTAELGVDQPAGVGFVASTPPTVGAGPTEAATLLVDVEGGILEPGIVELPADARVGDAIAAAGGYADDADILAAAASLNLAAPLADGQQVYVPLVGVANAPSGGGGATGGGGLVDLNTATPEELDALPGIGPVTVQKIVAARQEQPFATLEELVERKVLNSGQLDKVRDLVTV